ncbi:MAG: hypothetical protein ACI9BD_001299 [Candidatus Marinamargulisbacteria bacterium]|jgi:hypothetical protein
MFKIKPLAPFFIVSLAVGMGLLGGCKNEGVRVYNAPKDMILASAQNQGLPFTFSAPQNWTYAPGSGMRLGTFSVTNKEGSAELTLTSLYGEAGGLLANVNRWRGQLKLGSVESGSLARHVQSLDISHHPIQLVDLEERTQHEKKKRFLVGVMENGTQTFFFKLVGHHGVIETEKKTFLDFLKTVHFE